MSKERADLMGFDKVLITPLPWVRAPSQSWPWKYVD